MKARATAVIAGITLSGLFATSSARAQAADSPPPAADIPAPPPADTPAPPPAFPPPVMVTYPYVPPPPEPPPRPRGFSFKGYAGGAYRRIYDVNVGAAELGLAFGAQRGIYGDINMIAGKTEHGLTFLSWRSMVTGEARLGIVRLGGGAGFSVIGVKRITTGSLILGAGLALSLFGSVDLVQRGGHALYLGLRMNFDWLPQSGGDPDGALFGPSLLVGYRY